MAPSRVPCLLAALLAAPAEAVAAAASAAQDDESLKYPPLPGLKRVVVIGRHGNRTPNPQLQKICPTWMNEVWPGFKMEFAGPSRVGMAESEETGKFLRHRYRDFLPDGPYQYDSFYSFYSERLVRNVVSTLSVIRGMFPTGSGFKGLADDRPNVVPITTSQAKADLLMNCPRDGPCIEALKKDKDVWAQEIHDKIFDENADLLGELSRACEFNISKVGTLWDGIPRTVPWIIANIGDALSFGEEEGLDDGTINGRLSRERLRELHELVAVHDLDQNFGKPHQLTYWAGDFMPTLLQLLRMKKKHPDELAHLPGTKFNLYMSHRELLYTLATLWKMPIQFPDSPRGIFPPATSMIIEVYQDGVRLFFWTPSKPDHDVKARYMKEELPLTDLYNRGTLRAVAPEGCVAGELCAPEQLGVHYVRHVAETGSYVELCNVSTEEKYFSKGAHNFLRVKKWVDPIIATDSILLSEGMEMSRFAAGREAAGV